MTAAGCTLERYERERGRHLLQSVVDWWAGLRPDSPALIAPESGARLTWAEFARESSAMARRLTAAGFRKGDFLAVQAPFSIDHILLEHACFRAGVIHVPLDMRLPAGDVERAVAAVGARALHSPEDAARLRNAPDVEAPLPEIDENDGAQVIFTTGSTGAPKPALLSHRNITCQNFCLGTAFGFNERGRVLVNLPPSHVGGQAEVLMTTLFFGGAAVVLEAFDPARSLSLRSPPSE